MNVLYASVRNEVEKLLLKKRTIAFLIISAVIPLAAAAVVSIFQNSIGIIPITANQFPIFILGIFTNIFLPLFIAAAVAEMFPGELEGRTLKIILIRPITRIKVFTSKVICIGAYILLHLGIAFIISNAAILFLQGNDGYLGGFVKEILAYGVSVFPMLAIGIAVICIAQLFKSSGGALTISVLIYIAVSVISRLFPSMSRMVLTSYTDWYQLWIGTSLLFGRVFSGFVVLLAYSMIFFSIGFYAFDRKEL